MDAQGRPTSKEAGEFTTPQRLPLLPLALEIHQLHQELSFIINCTCFSIPLESLSFVRVMLMDLDVVPSLSLA
jgi:hypothetical protein